MLATPVLPDCQVAEAVRSCVLPSVNSPVAVNCWVVPSAMDGPGGFTVIEAKAATLTVRVVEDDTEPAVAEITHPPVATLVDKPWLPGALLIVATVLSEEPHCTRLVIS